MTKKFDKRRYKKNDSNIIESPYFKIGLISAAAIMLFISVPIASASFQLTSNQQQSNTRNASDAIKVYVTQESINSSLLGEAVVMAKQRLAAAESQMQLKSQVINAYNDFINPDSLTTNSKCHAANERANDAIAARKADMYAKSDLLTMSGIGSFTSESDRMQALVDMKSQISCTVEQAKAGYCTPNATGGQYYDVDFALLDGSKRLTDNQFTSAKLGVMTIANPTKDQKVVDSCQGDTACIHQVALQDSKIATSSLVVNSLLTKAYNRVSVGSAYDK